MVTLTCTIMSHGLLSTMQRVLSVNSRQRKALIRTHTHTAMQGNSAIWSKYALNQGKCKVISNVIL